jgi:hypothetical protein
MIAAARRKTPPATCDCIKGVITEGRAGRIHWDESAAWEQVRLLAFRQFVLAPLIGLARRRRERWLGAQTSPRGSEHTTNG